MARQKPIKVKDRDSLLFNLITALFFREFVGSKQLLPYLARLLNLFELNGALEALFIMLGVKPIDTIYCFKLFQKILSILLIMLGVEPIDISNTDETKKQWDTDTLFREAEKWAELIHEFSKKPDKVPLIEVELTNNGKLIAKLDPEFKNFLHDFYEGLEAVEELAKRLLESNPTLFEPNGFMIGPAFVSVLELLRRGFFGTKQRELVEKVIIEISNELEKRMAGWSKKLGNMDEIQIGEISLSYILKLCNKKFETLSPKEVRAKGLSPDQALSYIPNKVWQKIVRTPKKPRLKPIVEDTKGKKIVYTLSPVEEIVAYREQVEPVIKVLLEEKDKLSPQAKTQRLFIDIIIKELKAGNLDISPSVLAKKTKIPLSTAKKTLNRLKKRVPVLANLIS